MLTNINMISYKNIDLLNINLVKNDINFGEELLIIKTPRIYLTDISNTDNNCLRARIDTSINTHNRLKEVLLYISRIYKNNEIVSDIIEDYNFNILLDKNSRFFDSGHNVISKNSFNRESRAVCSIFIKNGHIYLHQCLKN